jgi:hypothetical protein
VDCIFRGDDKLGVVKTVGVVKSEIPFERLKFKDVHNNG